MTQAEYWNAREEIERECLDYSAKQSAIRELDLEMYGPDDPDDIPFDFFLMSDLAWD